MKQDSMLPERFAHVVLEELAMLRGELRATRSLLTELLSLTSREPRRQIKDRMYHKRLHGPMDIAAELKQKIGLERYSP